MKRTVFLISMAVLAATIVGAALTVSSDESAPQLEPVAESSPVPDPEPTTAGAPTIVGAGAGSEAPTDSATAPDLETTSTALDRRIQGLADRLKAAEHGTEQVDAIDADLAAAVDEEQAALADALDRFYWKAGTDTFDTLWRTVDLHGKALLRLAHLRISARDWLTEERRHSLTSFGNEGLEQAARESRSISLLVRYYIASRRHSIDEAPQMTRNLFRVGAAISRLLLVIAVLIAALWLRRHWRPWLEQLRTLTFRSVTSVAAKRRAQWLFRWGATIAPWGLFLVTIAALRRSLGPAGEIIEIETLLIALTVFGFYRLAVDVLSTVLVNVAVHYGLDASTVRRSMLLTGVRSVLRVATTLVLIALVSRAMGQGFMAGLVLDFAWLIVLVAVLVNLFRWRSVMIDTFLKLHPEGPLSATLNATRTHWYGALLAPAAFVWLAGRGIATVTQRFARGFEQTQRTLAFFFRRRVQRQAEITGYAEGDVSELPDELVEAFREDAVQSGPLVVSNFPGLSELHEILTDWRSSGARGSYLLTGERGVGKTSWLNQFRREDLEIHRIALGRRVTNPAVLCARLGELLAIDLGPDAGPRELARALRNGPAKVVILDMSQHLFLSTVGGYEAFKAFTTLVNRTCSSVFWLCSMSAYAWRHLRAVRSDATVFRTHRHLGGWSDEKINELIRTRCAASGFRFNYADLVVDRLEGVAMRSSLIESAEGYSRLLWDYADGNPRAALHFFVRSLDPESSSTVRVRLFRAPDVGLLESGGQDGLFVLAAIVTHESMSLDDLVAVTRFDRAQCFIHLDRLLEIGAVDLDGGMYRVSTTWHRAGVRLLRRRNLLPALSMGRA